MIQPYFNPYIQHCHDYINNTKPVSFVRSAMSKEPMQKVLFSTIRLDALNIHNPVTLIQKKKDLLF